MPSIMGPDGFSRGKTVFVLAVVVGCFAILWPKVFFPMFTASIGGNDEACCDVISEKDTNAYHIITELCQRILNHDEKPYLDSGQGRPPSIKVQQKIQFRKPMINVCRNEIKQQCGVDVALLLQDNSEMTKEFRDTLNQLRSFNTSHCLKISYGVDVAEIGLQRMTKAPHILSSHMRPERPFRPEMIHPALREKGRGIPSTTTGLPRRTIEREARPGPVPGVRPPVAQAAHITQNPKGSGTMGIVMPMYTIGIVCFFVYTLMKVVSWYFMINITIDYLYSCISILFKKPSEEVATTIVPPPRPQPILKDYGMDPEHRKFLHSEEYVNGSERSIKDELNKGDRELGIRRKGSGGSRGRFQEDRRRLDFSDEQLSQKSSNVDGGEERRSTPEPPTLTIQPPTPSTPIAKTFEPLECSEAPLKEFVDDNEQCNSEPLANNTTTTDSCAKIDVQCKTNTTPPHDSLTMDELTSAALFFDETIEEPDFESISTNNTDEPELKRSPSPELSPPKQIIEPKKPTPVEILAYAVSLASRIVADATSTVIVPNLDASNLPTNNFVTKNVEFKTPTTPLITLVDERRKKSEPILIHKPQSRLEITPVDDTTLIDNAVIDNLGGYVTMVDESRAQRAKRLKNLGSGVEITSIDDEEPVIHRVMSLDSNDSSVITVKELGSLDDNDFEENLETPKVQIESSCESLFTLSPKTVIPCPGPSSEINENNETTPIVVLDNVDNFTFPTFSDPSHIYDTNEKVKAAPINLKDDHETEMNNEEVKKLQKTTTAPSEKVDDVSELKIETCIDQAEIKPQEAMKTSRKSNIYEQSKEGNVLDGNKKPQNACGESSELQSQKVKSSAEQPLSGTEVKAVKNLNVKILAQGEVIKSEPQEVQREDKIETDKQSNFEQDTTKTVTSAFSLISLEPEEDEESSESLSIGSHPILLDFESLDPDPSYTMETYLQQFAGEPSNNLQEYDNMEMEFLPEVQPQSVPPITLESCTNPLRASNMMGLQTLLTETQRSETEADQDDLALTTPLDTPSPQTSVQSQEDCRSAKPNNEISGDATDQIQDVLLSQQEKVESAEKAKKVEGGVGGAALKESEPEPGHEDRDAMTALSGIIQQLQVEQASALEKAKQVETEKTLTKKAESESKKKKEIDIDLEQMRTSKETLEVVAEEGKKPAKSRTSAEKEVKFQLPPEEDEEEFEEEEEEEEEELVRPPTPPKSISKKSKHQNNHTHPLLPPRELVQFAQELSDNIIQQSAASAIAAVKSQGTQGHREILSVLGIEEIAEMESGEKWDDRTPTPTFRMATPPNIHRPPTPPEDIPSIFLEGPLPLQGQQLMVSDFTLEGENEDDLENANNPVVLSGKVTLSVISGGTGGAPDEITDASSLSYDDRAQAGKKSKAIKAEKGLINSRKGPASSRDVEDLSKKGVKNDEDDADLSTYLTAEADNDGQKMEDTAGDISVMDGLEDKHEELPRDEE